MKTKHTLSLLLLIIVFLFVGNTQALAIDDIEDGLFTPVEIKNGSIVSLKDCIANAFKNSPKIRHQKYNLDIATSNVGIAKSQYFPVIGAGVNFYHENNSDNSEFRSSYRELPRIGVTLNQLVWNFGKSTAYIKMEEFYKIGAEYEFMDSLCYTIFDVKAKYYNVLRTKAIVDIYKAGIKNREIFIKDVYKEPDIATAKLIMDMQKSDLIQAEINYKNAKIDLANAMYLDDLTDFDVKSTDTFNYSNKILFPFYIKQFDFKLEDAVDIAYKNNPDLQVLISTKNAMEQSLLYIKRTYLPDLTANVGYGFLNADYVTNNSLQVGVSLNSSVNLMNLRHSIKGAYAQLAIADNEILLFKKDLYYQVKRAINEVNKKERQIPLAKSNAQRASQNLKEVRKRYNTRELGYTNYRAAITDDTDWQVKYIDNVYEYNIALIDLEKALHYHMIDIHHKSDHAVHYHSKELIEYLNKVLGCDEKEVQKSKKKKK